MKTSLIKMHVLFCGYDLPLCCTLSKLHLERFGLARAYSVGRGGKVSAHFGELHEKGTNGPMPREQLGSLGSSNRKRVKVTEVCMCTRVILMCVRGGW